MREELPEQFVAYCKEVSYDELALILKGTCKEMAENHKKGTLSPEWLRSRYLIAYNEIRDREKAAKAAQSVWT